MVVVVAEEHISGSILVVEDPFVTGLLRNLLEKSGFSVLAAPAQKGVEMLRAGDIAIELLITNRPSRFAEFGCCLPLLYLAACPNANEVVWFRTWKSLCKPFRPGDIVDAAGELLGCGAIR